MFVSLLLRNFFFVVIVTATTTITTSLHHPLPTSSQLCNRNRFSLIPSHAVTPVAGSAGSLRRSVASHFAAASSPSSTAAARSSHSSRLQLVCDFTTLPPFVGGSSQPSSSLQAASVYTSRTLRPSTGPLRVTHSRSRAHA
jgi:hypothetical protein